MTLSSAIALPWTGRANAQRPHRAVQSKGHEGFFGQLLDLDVEHQLFNLSGSFQLFGGELRLRRNETYIGGNDIGNAVEMNVRLGAKPLRIA